MLEGEGVIRDDQIMELIYTFKRTSALFYQIVKEQLKDFDLTVTQGQVVGIIKRHGPQSLVDLSKKLDTSTSSLSGVVDRLERLDLVHRVRDQIDRRVVWIHLSEKCNEMIKKFPETQVEYLKIHMEELTEEDLDHLIQQLQKFRVVLEKSLERKDDKV